MPMANVRLKLASCQKLKKLCKFGVKPRGDWGEGGSRVQATSLLRVGLIHSCLRSLGEERDC